MSSIGKKESWVNGATSKDFITEAVNDVSTKLKEEGKERSVIFQ